MVNTSSTATRLQVPNTVPCLDKSPCQAQEAELVKLRAENAALRRDLSRVNGALERLQKFRRWEDELFARQRPTPAMKLSLRAAVITLEERRALRPSEPQRFEPIKLDEIASQCGVSRQAASDHLQDWEYAGVFAIDREEGVVRGRVQTRLLLGRGDGYADMLASPGSVEIVLPRNAPGGKRVCPSCHSKNLDIITTGKCRDCGTVFAVATQHQHEDEDEPETLGDLVPPPAPEPAPAPAPAPEPPSQSESWSNEPAEVAAQFGMEWQPGEIAGVDPGSIYDQMRVGTLMGRCDKAPRGMHEAGPASRRPGGPKMCVWCGADMIPEPAGVLA